MKKIKNLKKIAGLLEYSEASLNKIVFSHAIENLPKRLAKASILFLENATDKEREKFLSFFEKPEIKSGRVAGYSPFNENN